MIERIRAKNYKSLKELELDLRPLTVFVGPNASGKSNILDALALISGIARIQSVKSLIDDRGGYASCVWGGDLNRAIELEVTGRFTKQEDTGGEPEQLFGYGVELRGQQDQALIAREWIRLDGEVNEFRTMPSEWQSPNDAGGREGGPISPQTSGLQYVPQHWKAALPVIDAIKGWAFYHFNPRTMKAPQPVRKQYRLAEDGHDLSTVLHTLYAESHPAWDEIRELINVFLPRIEKLTTPIYDKEPGKTYIALREEGLSRETPSWAMSDGTLFALALATALVSPEVPNLIAIEAPDTEIHPRLMEHIAEILISASERTQVLATTHSPYLLSHLPPESIVIVENQNAQTVVKQVARNEVLQEAIKSLGAGRAWYAGHLGGTP